MLQVFAIFYLPGFLDLFVWPQMNTGWAWFDATFSTRFIAALVAFAINYAAYFSEIFRGGIQSISKGQYEAGQVLGMTKRQIFFKVIENRDLVPECVGMIQKEVAVRIAEPPGSREYGILSVLLQAWYDIEYLFTVSEKVFNPPPKVKSAVIRLRRNQTKTLGCDEALFIKVVKASFGQRRKMLRNSLRSVFGDFGGAEHPLFTTRAEQLSVAQFVDLTNWVAEHK